MQDAAERLIRIYYDIFNASAADRTLFLDLLTDDVVHDINQGGREVGKSAFAEFLRRMDRSYRERIELRHVLTEPTGTQAAAEFTVHGTYLQTDPDVPPDTAPARGQSYVLPAGAFFTLRGNRVARISNHYNLNDWVAQVSRP